MTEERVDERTLLAFKELISIHNRIRFKEATQSDFDNKLEQCLEVIRPGFNGFLGLLAERAEFTEDWLKENQRFLSLCKTIFEKFSEEERRMFNFKSGIKVAMLETSITEYLQPDNINASNRSENRV